MISPLATDESVEPQGSAITRTPNSRRFRPSLVNPLAIGLTLAVLVLDILRQGRPIQLVLAFGCVILALMLVRERPSTYIRFVLWSWCLAPFIRRLVDYRCGFSDQSLILAIPVLITTSSLYGLWPNQKISAGVRQLLPFLICLGAVFYGAATTVLLHPSVKFVYVALGWASPILFGLYLCAYPERLELHRRIILSTLLQALLLLGVYGLFQYIVMPPWDVYWLTNVMDVSGVNAFGRAEPGMLRVWSTFNAPGTFAIVLFSSLILLSSKANRRNTLAFILAVINLGLTLQRTAWIGLGIALFLLLFSANLKSLSKYLTVGILLLGSLPLLNFIPGASDLFHERIQSFTDPKGDESYIVRQEEFQTSLSEVLKSPLGAGQMSEPTMDGGIFEMLLSLGWPGTIAYLLALGVMLGNPYVFRRCKDTFLKSCQAVSVALVVLLLSGNTLVALPGLILWICIALYWSGTRLDGACGLTPQRKTFSPQHGELAL